MIQFLIQLVLPVSIKGGVRLAWHLLGINSDQNLFSKPVSKLKLSPRQVQNPMLGFHFIPVCHDGNMVKRTDQPFIKIGSIRQSVLVKPKRNIDS
ncbi:Uncharacterised protein [Actinobacillus pleuropneumoniae]|nr:Uncharacterised protein [Actinobacillus pleuropneumoniae]